MKPGAQSVAISRPPSSRDAPEWEMVVPKMTRPPQGTPRLRHTEPAQGAPPRRSLRLLTVFWLLILGLAVTAVILLKIR